MDTIKVQILEDGTIKLETDKVSAAVHTNAENLLSEMAKLTGGTVKKVHKGMHRHQHNQHTHIHQHHDH